MSLCGCVQSIALTLSNIYNYDLSINSFLHTENELLLDKYHNLHNAVIRNARYSI